MATVELSAEAEPLLVKDRDISQYSDHVTVWIDTYIGEPHANPKLKEKFDSNVQVLRTNNPDEAELDDVSMLFIRSAVLEKLRIEVYCLNYFSTVEAGLAYIRAHPEKKIFFISSGTIGRIIVPQIAELPQIEAIYIFCGDILRQLDWASNYVTDAFLMFDHQDDLLERLTRDLGVYVESKGDQYEARNDFFPARNCFIWAKKLYVRYASATGTKQTDLIETITVKINRMQSSREVSG